MNYLHGLHCASNASSCKLKSTQNDRQALSQGTQLSWSGFFFKTLLLCLSLVFAACSSSTPPSAFPSTPTPTKPDSSGLKQIDQAALQTLVDNSIKEFMVPGAVVLLRTPQGEFLAASGTTKLGGTTRPTAETYFRIASNTKTITGALIVLLAQEGKLSLDDPISKYLPNVPNGDKITITHLLEMRSGLYNYTEDPKLSASMDTKPSKAWTPAELLAMSFARPPNFAPGSAYEYCNTNFVILGLVAEKLDGKPLRQVMHDRLFAPLNLRHTLLPELTDSTIPEPYSHGYLYGGAGQAFLSDSPPYSAEVQAAARAGKLLPTDFTHLNHSFAWATGGAISTAADMATWIQALVEGRVLNAEYQRRWFASLKPENPDRPAGQKYGFGISQFSWGPNAIYFHGGETAGFNSKISYDLGNQIALIIWTNLTLSLDDQQTANTLFLRVLDHIYKVSPLTPASTPKPTS